MTERGVFLTFEGPDGSGKSTQMHLLAERLRAAGRTVIETVEPGGTEIGQQIRRILLDPANHKLSATAELLLYFAARAQNVDELIVPQVAAGAVVLADRYTDSTRAYQGAGRALGREVVEALHHVAVRGCEPELTILVDIDTETGLARAHARNREKQAAGEADESRLDAESRAFHGRVRAEYLRIAAAEPGRVRVIDGRGSVAEVAARVWAAYQEFMERRG